MGYIKKYKGDYSYGVKTFFSKNVDGVKFSVDLPSNSDTTIYEYENILKPFLKKEKGLKSCDLVGLCQEDRIYYVECKTTLTYKKENGKEIGTLLKAWEQIRSSIEREINDFPERKKVRLRFVCMRKDAMINQTRLRERLFSLSKEYRKYDFQLPRIITSEQPDDWRKGN